MSHVIRFSRKTCSERIKEKKRNRKEIKMRSLQLELFYMPYRRRRRKKEQTNIESWQHAQRELSAFWWRTSGHVWERLSNLHIEGGAGRQGQEEVLSLGMPIDSPMNTSGSILLREGRLPFKCSTMPSLNVKIRATLNTDSGRHAKIYPYGGLCEFRHDSINIQFY